MSTWPVLVLGIYLGYLVYLSTWSTVLDPNPDLDYSQCASQYNVGESLNSFHVGMCLTTPKIFKYIEDWMAW